jgi:glycosyltransferase involved in cell wall biosynthesis
LTPKVSIVTPLYNSSPHIERTLDSVLAQTRVDWEAILVDDGSTDDTRRVVEPYLRDPRFSYTQQRNQGIAGARNTGIRAARGDWVCLLDHDDRWLPTKLERQLAFTEAHGLDISATDAVVVQDEARRRYSDHFTPEVLRDLGRSPGEDSVALFRLLIQGNFLCASSVMIRRSCFDRVGLLDAQCAPADDYEMWLRCMPEARIGYLHEPLIEYYLHQHNYSHDQFRMIRKELYALRKTRSAMASTSREYRDLLSQRIRQLSRSTARAYLDEYHRLTRQGPLSEAFPFLWKAARLAPAEVFPPRRLLAAFKHGARAGFNSRKKGRM